MMKTKITLLLTVMLCCCLAVSAAWAESTEEPVSLPDSFQIDAYSYEELEAIRDAVEARLNELEVQHAVEHLNRRMVFMNQEVIVLLKKYTRQDPTVIRLTEDAPNDTPVVWSSSDPSIATVSANGQVAGVSAGEAVITATAKENEYLSASFTVRVVVPVEKITVWSETDSLLLGKEPELAETTLGFSVEPEDAYFQTVSWTSSDLNIATVDPDGTVHGVGPGTVILTAVSDEDPELGGLTRKATYTLKVQQSVTDLELDQTELRIGVGEKATLTATALPENAGNRTVSFESDNPEVVTTDTKGHLTANAGGIANITVTALDGSGVSAICRVEVIQPVTGLTLSENEVRLPIGATRTVEAEITPDNATYPELLWTSSNVFVAQVADGRIEATGQGDCVITCATTDGSGVSAQIRVRIPTFSIEEEAYTVSDKGGLLIPILYNQRGAPVEIEGASDLFTAEVIPEQGIQITPLAAGTGTLVLNNADAPQDKTEVQITVENTAVFSDASYPQMNYEDVVRNLKAFSGSLMSVRGKVLQVQGTENGEAVFNLGTGGTDYSDQVLLIRAPEDILTDPVMPGDLMTVYGSFTMEKLYSEALGSETLIPALLAERVELKTE